MYPFIYHHHAIYTTNYNYMFCLIFIKLRIIDIDGLIMIGEWN